MELVQSWSCSNCPKYVGFYSKSKFEKLVILVGFIIRMLFYDCSLIILYSFISFMSHAWNPIYFSSNLLQYPRLALKFYRFLLAYFRTEYDGKHSQFFKVERVIVNWGDTQKYLGQYLLQEN